MFYSLFHPRRRFTQYLSLWCMAWMVVPLQFPVIALANPDGGTAAGGSTSITSGPGQVTVNQTSNRAVVNWNGFSINKGETTTFVQPSAKSAILNRVTGGSVSRLDGNLNANGQVYLVNKNGVVVGKTGRVNAGGFTASTHDVADAEFMKGGDLNFSGTSSASVINQGKIRATDGDVTLIARQVENQGRITARKGSVNLAGGTEVLLKPSGSDGQRIFIKSTSGGGSVANSGSIRAAAAELRAAGGNEYALAVNNSGVIRATGVDKSGGRIVLKAQSGTVQNSGKLIASSKAPGKRGGSVVVTGENVRLTSTSRIDVSSTGTGGQGGTVNIGGGYQGRDAAIANAKSTSVEAGSVINADGEGKGGTVIVWSDDKTSFLGSITAAAIPQAGSSVTLAGGFVEVSSKGSLDFRGHVDTGGGTLLLDPLTLEIINGGGVDKLDPVALAGMLNLNNVNLQADNFIRVTNAMNSSANTAADIITKNNLTFTTPTLFLNAAITLKAGATLSGTPTVVNVGYVSPTVQGRLQNAVDAVANGGTINLAAGTFFGNTLIKGKTVTIIGAGPSSTILDGNAADTVLRLFAPAGTVSLSGLTITNGRSVSSTNGGGIYSLNSGTITITNCNISGNVAGYGGAIFNLGGTITITNSTLSGNVASNGGAVYHLSGTITILNSTISGNSTSGSGGGIFIHAGVINVDNSTLVGNSAYEGGGAVVYSSLGTMNFTNSTISGNSSEYGGGGGVSNFAGGIATFKNTIIVQNSSDDDGPNVNGAAVDLGYNLVGSTADSTGFGTAGTVIVADSAAGLAPLGFYGGPTQTVALLVGSPALNVGTGTSADQRGKSVNGVRDIGAFEAQPAGAASNYVVTNTQDYIAGINPIISGSLRFALAGNLEEKPTNVTFNIPGTDIGYSTAVNPSGVWTIRAAVGTAGFVIQNGLTIDATTQPGYSLLGGPRIIVDGNRAGGVNANVFLSNPVPGQTVTFRGIGITGGNANQGGGINVSSGNLTIEASRIYGNVATNYGGGIYYAPVAEDATLSISDSTLDSNQVTMWWGGGIYANSQGAGTGVTLNINRSTISNNSSASSGGGIYFYGAELNIENSTMSGNSSNHLGGAIWILAPDGAATITSSTIVNNRATTDGSAFYVHSARKINLQNTIMALNTGSAMVGWGSVNDLGNNILSGDPLLAPLGDYGGPTQTHALQVGSPALNAGSTALGTDQRGQTRGAVGSQDIGAYEVSATPLFANYVVRTTADYNPGVTPVVANSLRLGLSGLAEAPTTVTFDIPDTFRAADVWTITAAPGAGAFRILNALTIDGASQPTYGSMVTGPRIIISADATETNSVFVINPGAGKDVVLNKLGITGGKGTLQSGQYNGTGLYVTSGNLTIQNSDIYGNNVIATTSVVGGGVNFGGGGSLTITDSYIHDNNLTATGNASVFGGGVFFSGSLLTISGSTISNNHLSTINGIADGGGLFILGSPATISKSTFYGNTVNRNAGSAGSRGGGIIINNNGSLTLDYSTVADNTGDGIYILSGTLETHNSIIANNIGSDVRSTGSGSVVAASSYNIIRTSTGPTGFNPANGNLLNVNPLLAPLGDYGGPTQTMALLPGSPALDASNPATTGTTDQRGVAQIGTRDIGAYESRGFVYTAVSGNGQSAMLTQAFAPLVVTVSALDPGLTNLTGGKVTLSVPVGVGVASATYAPGSLTQTLALVGGTYQASFALAANLVRGMYSASVETSTSTFSLTNTAVSITITPNAGQGKNYGEADALPYGYMAAGIPGVDLNAVLAAYPLTGMLTRATGEDAGTYAITQGTLSSSANYFLTFNPGSSFSIIPRSLLIAPESGQGKDFGSPDPALRYFLATSALVSGDSFTGALSRITGEAPGTYNILPGTLTAGPNYSLSFAPGFFTVGSIPQPPALPLPDALPTMDTAAFDATRGRNNEDEKYYLNALPHTGGNIYYAPAEPATSPGSIYSSSSAKELGAK